MKIITFDFDNTMAMSYMNTTGDKPNPVFQEYNYEIIDEIKKNIEEGNEVYLVTSRKEDLEKYFPKLSIPFHLKQLGLDEYFLPDRLFYTNSGSKRPILLKLGTELHYDDDIEEHSDALDSKYQVKQPLDGFPDSNIVGKAGIFDSEGNVLILQRSDEGHFWDLPGGHIKHIEAARVPSGVKDGTEREIFEETGLLMPFLKELTVYDFNYRGKSYVINIYITQLESKKPYVRLDIQDHIENIDYKWISMEEMESYLTKSTANLRKMHSELSVMKQIFETNEPYQLKMKKKHHKGKKNMVGFGKNKNFGGGKGHSRPEMSRSKSAPPMAETIGDEKWPKKFFKERKLEENDEKSKKKVKIKVKITQNLDEKRKKRKKSAKKRQKSRKNKAKSVYLGGYFNLYDGDSGGDGGGGGE